jgi:hypothetical protein
VEVAGEKVGSIAGAEFGEQRGHVTFDGPHRQVQLSGDIGVGQPGRQEGEDVGFSAVTPYARRMSETAAADRRARGMGAPAARNNRLTRAAARSQPPQAKLVECLA